MSDELLKWLIQTGVGGIVGGISIYLLVHQRREQRADMRDLRVEFNVALENFRSELADALEHLPAWLQAIHSRLSSLGADSVPPPLPQPPRSRLGRRQIARMRTAPHGHRVGDPDTADDENG